VAEPIADTLWTHARLLTTVAEAGAAALRRHAIAARDGRIVWVGPATEAPPARRVIDLEDRLVTPGLIDCHTHLVHAGSRAGEFERRLAGASYEQVAREGGGILSTVRATRAASEAELVAAALPRLDALLAEGVTTIEIKSGYGLDHDTEARMLRAARALAGVRPVTVCTTYLGAHAIPPEMPRAEYLAAICNDILPRIAAAGLADAVDAFAEGIAFSANEVAQVFEAARGAGLPVKLHADQLSNLGGAALAARYRALSADHLEYTDETGVAALAEAGTAAVLLPGAFYVLRAMERPPIEALRQRGVAIAVATDCNPGSSPLSSLLLAMNMAAVLFGLTVPECLAGTTRQAARALGLAGEAGTLKPGAWCDLAVWDVEQPAELVYRIGLNPLWRRVWHDDAWHPREQTLDSAGLPAAV
jgi:imidazolonepropionase